MANPTNGQSFNSYWFALSSAQKKRLAAKLKTSTEYLYQIATGRRSAGSKFTIRLAKETGVPKKIIRPDIFGEAA